MPETGLGRHLSDGGMEEWHHRPGSILAPGDSGLVPHLYQLMKANFIKFFAKSFHSLSHLSFTIMLHGPCCS